MFVLGIDPGLTRCGYGVVERLSARRNRAVAAGVLRTDPADDIPVRLAELQADDDRPMVVNLWATWCAPCLAEMPDLEAFHRQRGAEIQLIGLNISDSPTRAAELTAELGITYLLGRDPEGVFVEALGAVGLPVTAFITRQGRLALVHQGPLDLERLADLAAEHL